MVRQKYAEIANQDPDQNAMSCCGVGQSCGTGMEGTYTIFAEDSSGLEGYAKDADLGLGCGLPTAFAGIQPGYTVLDLGSGAGNDCFVARAQVGEKGKVIGVDMTPEMIERARINADKLGYNNVEFRQGEIEKLPVAGQSVDVVVSNCVMNLVPDKNKAFSETFRVLKNGGHFCISDVVIKGVLPEKVRSDMELYAGCVAGAVDVEKYLSIIAETGFENIRIAKMRKIEIPDSLIAGLGYSSDEIEEWKNSGTGIFSITVLANKPQNTNTCCGPGCCSN
jgi:SAM-dependent methyltransferase